MFTTVRTFRLRSTNIDDVVRRIHDEIGPTLKKIPGFKSYRIVDFRDGTYGSISIFETEQAANKANSIAFEAAGVQLADILEITGVKVWRTLLEAADKD
ncbi:MAG: hypothetical protein WA820_16765 [Bradyrhizobium sp.]